jgi:hypothetical protein
MWQAARLPTQSSRRGWRGGNNINNEDSHDAHTHNTGIHIMDEQYSHDVAGLDGMARKTETGKNGMRNPG